MNYVEINGEQLPIKFGYKLVRKYMAKFKLKKWTDWTQLPNLVEIDHMPDVLHLALECGAKTAGDEFKMSAEETETMLDFNPHLITELWDIFIDDMTPASKKEAVKEAMTEAEEEAKNLVGID